MRLRWYTLENEEEMETKCVELLEHGCGVVMFELTTLDVFTIMQLQSQFDMAGFDKMDNDLFLTACYFVDKGLYKRLNSALNKLYSKEISDGDKC